MVRMSAVWDRATEVIAGRTSILASIVLSFVWLPSVVQRGLRLAVYGDAPPASPGAVAPGIALALALVGLVVLALAIVGHLALVAVASNPSVSRNEALRIAMRRFWPYLGLVLLVSVALLILILPILIPVLSAYPSLAAMQAGGPPQMAPGTGLFVLVYALVLTAAILWVEARVLMVLTPVIVNERLGLGAFGRAFALTGGLTWRIVGVLLLFIVVAVVALLALQSVVGIIWRLLLGFAHDGLTVFLTAAVVGLLACVLSVIVAAFTAQLYVATRAEQPAA